MLAEIETAALRICDVMPNLSDFGKEPLAE